MALKQFTSFLNTGSKEFRGAEVWILRIMMLVTVGLISYLAADQLKGQFPTPMWVFDESRVSQIDKGSIVWTRLQIPEGTLESMGKMREPLAVYLGNWQGSYQVWINGLEVDRGRGERFGSELWLRLPPHFLSVAGDLPIIIRSERLVDARVQWRKMRTVQKVGVYKSSDMEQSRRGWVFQQQARHYLLFALYFLFGFLFYAVWRISSERWDYCFFSAYALLEGLIHVAFSANSQWQTDGYRLLAPLFFTEAIFCLRVGLSFARISRRVTSVLYPVFFIGLGLITYVYNSDAGSVSILLLHQKVIFPAIYFLCAVVCWLQLWHVHQERIQGIRRRKWRLLKVGLLFAGIGGAYLAENALVGIAPSFASWSRHLNLVLLFYVAHIFIRELQVESSRNNPWSLLPFPREKPRAA